MKICKLKLKNLNSFRDSVEIDFENPPLDDASLVAITGPTGAGKTTLLDAICVALYGKTPRLTGTGSQNPSHLISHGEKNAFAEVIFMANGTRYLATWAIRQNGAPKVQLFYADDGKLISDKLSTRSKSLGSSQNTVSEEVESILGLDFDAFRRSVMLAQGEFAAFLKASNEERRTILEATAGVSIYDVLKQALNDKVSEVEATNAEVYDKLNRIPEASREQLADAEAELDRLQTGTDALGAESQQIQQKKDRETKRTEDFEKLQSSEKRQQELLAQQPEIDTLQTELENANRAQRLLPEKQTFDNAKSALAEAKEASHVATTGKTKADKQVKANQANFDEKEITYRVASDNYDQQMKIYTEAKLDVKQAENKFADANGQVPEFEGLGEQIKELSSQLDSKRSEQSQLTEKIQEAQTFLHENWLPSDRQQRLNRVTGLLVELTSHKKQLQTELTNKTNAEKNVSSLKQKIKKLSNAQQKRLSEKTEAETTLEDATTELNKLLATGTHEEWSDRKQQAARAYPVVQGYEEIAENSEDILERLDELNGTLSILNAELGQIKAELQEQIEVCRYAAKAVERCEEALRSEMLTNPINQLRQHLHTGEPCRVCGATEHPYADVVEPENAKQLQDAKDALENAKAEAQVSQDQMQVLKTKQTQTEHDRRNAVNRTEELTIEARTFLDKKEGLDRQWKEIRPDLEASFDPIVEQDVINISFDWIVEQMSAADTAIAALGEAERARTEALHAYEMVSQQLETCETDVKRETNALNETETQLESLNNTITDLQADIKETEERFWESIPDTFHGVKPTEAVDQFENKIEAVASREDKRDTAETQLQVLNTKIESDQNNLESLRQSHKEVQSEIDQYRQEGEAFLDAVREETDGLETEAEINAAVSELETELEAKKNEHDEAQQQLQESQSLLTEKQTDYKIRAKQHKADSEKFKAARSAYFNKLEKSGFNSPEAHDTAFRDDDQIQDLTNQINAHEDEMRELASEIRELSARFDENPFDPDALERIECQLEEIETQLQEAQQAVGAQQQKIEDIKDALEKRDALGDELDAAQQELERWQRLHEIIPRNDLRDFALEIMFKQMGSLANEQLKYLTSERYQLKVESIGNLTVIDRWNANEERPVQTLSGGESFLTSLALALALSELSSGRAQLNSLFLDEGFGTLDSETLDTAIAALEGLQMQGRNIYLISHIQELTRRLPVKINVRKRGNGSSSVKIQG